MNNKKKRIYSLGMNCEVTYQIERFFGTIDSCLFSWAFVLDDNLFLEAIKNINDIFEHDVHFHMPSADMFIDEKYQITFHGRTNKQEMFNEEDQIIDMNKYNDAIAELTSRIDHLKTKWKKQTSCEDKTVFIKKLWWPDYNAQTDRKRIISYIEDFYNTFDSITSGDYLLCIVIEDSNCSSEIKKLESDRLWIRTVDFFSPIDNTQFGADDSSWDKILQEIDGIPGM